MEVRRPETWLAPIDETTPEAEDLPVELAGMLPWRKGVATVGKKSDLRPVVRFFLPPPLARIIMLCFFFAAAAAAAAANEPVVGGAAAFGRDRRREGAARRRGSVPRLPDLTASSSSSL
jgi:hypothetical protein